jgi:hypothetical protein
MRGAVVSDQEHAVGGSVRLLTHDLRDQSVEGSNPGLALAAAEQFGTVDVPGGDVGTGASAGVFMFHVDRPPWGRGPVLRRAFLRLASICRNEKVIGRRPWRLGGLIEADVGEAGFRCAFWALDHAHAQKYLHSPPVRAVGSLPQLPSYYDRIDLVGLPPCDFVAVSMECPMMAPAKRHSELIADPTAQRAWLGEPQMVGIRRPPTNQAGLRRHESEVVTVAVPARFVERERGFVDMPRHRVVDPAWQSGLPRVSRAGRRVQFHPLPAPRKPSLRPLYRRW